MRVWLNRFAVLLLLVPEAVLAALWLLTRQRVWAVVLAVVTLALVVFAASAMRARAILRRGWAATPPGAIVETVTPPEPPHGGWPEVPQLQTWGRLGNDAYPVTTVAFGPRGRILATVNREGKLRLWDTADPARPVLLGQAPTAGCRNGRVVRFAPDGHLLAVAGNGIVLWDVTDPTRPRPTAALAASPRDRQRQHAVAFHPTRRLPATGQAKGIWIWDLTGAPRPLRTDLRAWHWYNAPGPVQSLTFTPDGRHLIADGGNTIAVLDTTLGVPVPPTFRLTGVDEGGGQLAHLTGTAQDIRHGIAVLARLNGKPVDQCLADMTVPPLEGGPRPPWVPPDNLTDNEALLACLAERERHPEWPRFFNSVSDWAPLAAAFLGGQIGIKAITAAIASIHNQRARLALAKYVVEQAVARGVEIDPVSLIRAANSDPPTGPAANSGPDGGEPPAPAGDAASIAPP
jgi:hypothetical protein